MALKKTSLIIALLLLFIAAFNATASAQPRKTGKNKTSLKQAKEHLSYEEYQQAIPHIQELLNQDKDNAYYNFWMGKCLFITYKKNSALSYFETVEKSNPAVAEDFHYYYALTLHYNLKLDKAIEQYQLDLRRYYRESEEYKEIGNRIAHCNYAKRFTYRPEGELIKINNLGDRINTEFSEHSPVISGDGKKLYYTARRPDCLGAQPEVFYYDEDIYVSDKQGSGAWSVATNISTPVNSKGHDATISLTPDASRLYIYRHKKAGGLYVTDLDTAGNEWQEPKVVEKPLNSKYHETTICQSADGAKLYFTSNRPGGYGGTDIYKVSKTEDDKWGDPENLGPQINTPFDEDAPYFHPDNRTLYFSSNGPNSLGGYDIFVTEIDSSGEGWLPPLNMGPPINTPDDDIYFVLSEDGLTGFFSSGKEGGFGEKDIYEIKFPYFRYPKRYYAIKILGMIEDENTHDTLTGMVRLINQNTGLAIDSMETTREAWRFQFELESELPYLIQVQSQGYDSYSEAISAPKLVDDDILFEKNISLKRGPVSIPPPKDMPQFMHVYFDFDKFGLREESVEELNRVMQFLKENPALDVEIVAHTDWYGTNNYNIILSENRSKTVTSYLRSQGLPVGRISSSWMSENYPILTNENDEGRQYNRRVELRFIDNSKILFTSGRLRPGVEAIRVDHTRPKGLPGFDAGEGSNPTAGEDEVQSPQTNPVNVESGNPVTTSGSNANSDAAGGMSIHNIYFDFDKSGLRSESRTELDKIAALVKQNPTWILDIRGHTDSYGSSEYNQALSDRRSQTARNYLLSVGVSETQIRMQSLSENLPIDSNSNDIGRQFNRRVEFVLYDPLQKVLESTK